MPDAYSVLLQRLQAAFDTVVPGADPVLRRLGPGRLPGQRRPSPGQGAGPRPPRRRRGSGRRGLLDDICAAVEISGPGFINLTLADEFVSDQLAAWAADARWGCRSPPTRRPW